MARAAVPWVLCTRLAELRQQSQQDSLQCEILLGLCALPPLRRKRYEADWQSKDVRVRQIATALYFIDVLALRAGHEKDEEEADTVGCCNLKVHLGHCGI